MRNSIWLDAFNPNKTLQVNRRTAVNQWNLKYCSFQLRPQSRMYSLTTPSVVYSIVSRHMNHDTLYYERGNKDRRCVFMWLTQHTLSSRPSIIKWFNLMIQKIIYNIRCVIRNYNLWCIQGVEGLLLQVPLRHEIRSVKSSLRNRSIHCNTLRLDFTTLESNYFAVRRIDCEVNSRNIICQDVCMCACIWLANWIADRKCFLNHLAIRTPGVLAISPV